MFPRTLIFTAFISIIICLPATFDLRYQPSTFNAYYQAQSQTICQAYTWSNKLSQIMGNAYSLVMKKKIKLSGQQIAQCMGVALNDVCSTTTIENIMNAISHLRKNGAVEQSCKRNRYFEEMGRYCNESCDDGGRPTLLVMLNITEENDMNVVFNKLGEGRYSAFSIVEVYDQMKYYSPDHEEHWKAAGDFYGVTVGEIVGWKKGGKSVTMKVGGPGWGFKGYANVPVDSPLIKRTFTVFYDKQAPRPSDQLKID